MERDVSGPRIVSIISAFNEEDIISATIEHLVRGGVEVYLLDNESTDETVAEASRWLGKGLLAVETIPQPRDPLVPSFGYFSWSAILRRKEELTQELKSDWFMHQDADEIREPPWADVSFQDALSEVENRGFNCVDFEVFNFRPVDDGFRRGLDPADYFRWYEPAPWFDSLQLKCWKAGATPVHLVATAGHVAMFSARRVFPIKFILRHYPIRSSQHGARKVFIERKPRFSPSELSAGWHRQYDGLTGSSMDLLWDRETLLRYDGAAVRNRLCAEERP